MITVTRIGATCHAMQPDESARLVETMDQFGVLTNRKRAVIALIHSIVFLGVAASGFVSPKVGTLHGNGTTGDFVLIGIYLIVSSILFWLITISRAAVERVYFAVCAVSAMSGLARTIFGDHAIPPAQYVRVVMLSTAVALGFGIVRGYSRGSAGSKQLSMENSQDSGV